MSYPPKGRFPLPQVDDIAATYIGQAAASPHAAPEILRRGARYFAGLAMRPENARLAARLAQVAQEFQEVAGYADAATVDDFRERLQETAQGLEASDIDLDVTAIRDQLHEAQATGPGHVSIAPATFRNDSTVLGREATIKWAPSQAEKDTGIQQTASLLYWQGEKEEAAAFTVDLTVVALPLLDPNARPSFPTTFRSYAEIVYGADGNKTRVVVDAGFGVRLTGVGNYCSVTVGMEFPGVTGTAGAPVMYGASLGMFAAPSLAPVFRSAYLDDIGDGATTGLIQRPSKATYLLPPVSNAAAGTVTIWFVGASGTNQQLYQVQYPFGVPPTATPVPLTADVAYVYLVNNTGQIANFRLPFQLSM